MRLLALLLLATLTTRAPADALYDKIKAKVGQSDDFHFQELRRLGDKTVEVEVFIVGEGEPDMAGEILCEPWKYGDWAVNKINHNPRGGDYRLQILSLTPDPKDKNTVVGRFFLKLGVIDRPLDRGFKVTCENKDRVTQVKAVSMPESESMLESADLVLNAYPVPNKPGRLWIYVSAKVKLRSWVLYEALPEKLLNRETGERALIVLENYQSEEQRRLAAKLAQSAEEVPEGATVSPPAPVKSSQTPKEKTAKPASRPGSRKK